MDQVNCENGELNIVEKCSLWLVRSFWLGRSLFVSHQSFLCSPELLPSGTALPAASSPLGTSAFPWRMRNTRSLVWCMQNTRGIVWCMRNTRRTPAWTKGPYWTRMGPTGLVLATKVTKGPITASSPPHPTPQGCSHLYRQQKLIPSQRKPSLPFRKSQCCLSHCTPWKWLPKEALIWSPTILRRRDILRLELLVPCWPTANHNMITLRWYFHVRPYYDMITCVDIITRGHILHMIISFCALPLSQSGGKSVSDMLFKFTVWLPACPPHTSYLSQPSQPLVV